MELTRLKRIRSEWTLRKVRKFFKPSQVIYNLLVLSIIAICLLPFIWVVSTSLKTSDEVFARVPSLIPRHPTLKTYRWMFTRRDMSALPLKLWNSAKVTGGALLFTIIISSMGGYGFARLKFRGRDLLFASFLIMMFIPKAGGLMAWYELMDFLHLRNSHFGLSLAFTTYTLSTFIMRQTFLSLPRELEEAAIIDGANTWQVFLHVALPMSTGGIAVVAILNFVFAYGDWLFTWTMLDHEELDTIAVAVTKVTGVAAVFTTYEYSPYAAQAATQVVAMTPVILVFIFLQRLFMRGLREGILKL